MESTSCLTAQHWVSQFGAYWWLCLFACLVIYILNTLSPFFFLSLQETFKPVSVWVEPEGKCWWFSKPLPLLSGCRLSSHRWHPGNLTLAPATGYTGWGTTVPLGSPSLPLLMRGALSMPFATLLSISARQRGVWTCGCDLWPTSAGLLQFYKFLLTSWAISASKFNI